MSAGARQMVVDGCDAITAAKLIAEARVAAIEAELRSRPATRPILGERHGEADGLIREYAAEELHSVRKTQWYRAFSTFSTPPSGRRPSPDKLGRLDMTGWILNHVMRGHSQYGVHYNTISAVYFVGDRVKARAWRASLDCFSRRLDEWRAVQEPANSL